MKKWSLLIILFLILAGCNSSKDSDGPSSVPINDDNPFDPNNPVQCLAVDTDGDGLIDCKDPDIDGDSRLNEVDAFPFNPLEWLDTDGDNYGDNSDRFPLDPTEWSDNENDGVGDNADGDDDNDGVPDIFEYFGMEKTNAEWIDVDSDRLGFSLDDDDDNDGCPSILEDLPYNGSGCFDVDNDQVPNSQDSDIDGDGVLNLSDAFAYDPLEWTDTDSDRLGNNVDYDDDNDGFPDSWEDFPLNKDYQYDSDGDSFANELDAFPYNSNEWIDSDNDGVGDNSDPFPFNPLESADTDLDGIGDNSDTDIDNDGFRNCIPLDLITAASCNQDKFPKDSTEWVDTDLDLVGDNADADDDNDGVADVFDTLPKEKLHFSDFDADSIPDSTFPEIPAQASLLAAGKVFFVYDEDADNDGCPNTFDDLSYDRFDCFDIDNDKIGNTRDTDKDGDGVLDLQDLFPYDPTEAFDFDEDGIGDNKDEDDDNDGVSDNFDTLSKNRFGFSDLNSDGIPDQGSLDLDGDGKTNGLYDCTFTNIYKRGYNKAILNPAVSSTQCTDALGNIFPAHSCSVQYAQSAWVCQYPAIDLTNLNIRSDLYPFNSAEFEDLDFDNLASKLEDEDDDNDGVPDLFDQYPDDKREDKEYSFADLDSDGVPSHTYKYNNVTAIWEFIFDADIDGDGTDQGTYSCVARPLTPSTIDCFFQKRLLDNVENPRVDVPGEPATIEVTRYFDHFPYNPDEILDYDLDGVGDNSDIDADGDGKFNCVPLTLDASAGCNQDQLPLTSFEDPFRNAKYYPFVDSNLSAISYCIASDCHFVAYDRDSDGLTDYQEYQLASNPTEADTDEDGVPDLIERDQGTDLDDENDFLDQDKDGLPDFLDKTPKGAFDETSLREQITNAGVCGNKQFESVCIDSTTDLCSWQLIEPAQFVNDPENPTGPQIRAGKCISKDILLTKDIDLNDCLDIIGEVNLLGRERYTVNITNQVVNGPRCSGALVTPIRMQGDSSLTINNIHIQSEVVDQLIESEGNSLSMINSSVYLEKDKLPGVIKFNQSVTGNLNLFKTTLVTKLPSDVSPTGFTPLIDANVRTMSLNSVILDCNLNNWTDLVTAGFICAKTQSNTTQASYFGASITSETEPVIASTNVTAWKHQSVQSTALGSAIKAMTNYKGIELNGLGFSYTPSQIFIADISTFLDDLNEANEYSYLKVNGSNIPVKVQGEVLFGELLKGPLPQLFCSEKTLNPGDPVSDLHPYYFVASPLNANLTQATIQSFNGNSPNLTPDGMFTAVEDFFLWNDFKGQTSLNFDLPLVAPAIYEGESARLNADSTFGAGIGKYVSVAPGKKYQVKFLAKAVDANQKDILLDVKLFESNTGNVIRSGKIYLKTDPDQVNSYDPALGLVTQYVNYVNEYIQFNFTVDAGLDPLETQYGISIENNEIAVSKDVYIDEVQFRESVEYNVQYSGMAQPFCTE